MSIEISEITAGYGQRAVLTGVTLSVEAGQLLTVLGPSGSGKTTLLRVIAGLHGSWSGRVSVHGRDVTTLPPEKRGIGLVPQEGALFPHLTVAGNVAYGLNKRRLGKHALRQRVTELLELVELAELASRLPHQLSGGQQQRVALARALAPNPSLVLLDEPFSSLDTALREDLRSHVVSVLRAQGVPAVLITHDQNEALSISDRVAVLDGGALVQVGSPAHLYRRPVNRWVAEFVGEAVILDGLVDRGRVETALGPVAIGSTPPTDPVLERPPHSSGTSAEVLLRPEQLELRRWTPETPGAHGIIRELRFFGHDQLATIELPTGAVVTARSQTVTAWNTGDDVALHVNGDGHLLRTVGPGEGRGAGSAPRRPPPMSEP